MTCFPEWQKNQCPELVSEQRVFSSRPHEAPSLQVAQTVCALQAPRARGDRWNTEQSEGSSDNSILAKAAGRVRLSLSGLGWGQDLDQPCERRKD